MQPLTTLTKHALVVKVLESTPSSIGHLCHVVQPAGHAVWTTMAYLSFTDDHGTTIHMATTSPSSTLVARIDMTGWYLCVAVAQQASHGATRGH
jgi:hypothetical protein